MRLYVILRYLALTLILNGCFLLLSGLISLVKQDAAVFPLFYSALVTFLFAIFPLIFIPVQYHISMKEGLAIVVYSWLLSCLVGTLPYVLWGDEFTFTNAWFESVSGFTTTGSSILRDIETLPAGLLFWRSATHFIGGIGIIILVLSVLPSISLSGNVLYRSEATPWTLHEFRQSARQSVLILSRVYVGLVLLETLTLFLCGISLFDSVTTSFATVATGGFSPHQASIAGYGSLPVELVVIVFMIISGMHFGLLFAAVRGDLKALLRSSATRFYLVILLVGTVLVTSNIHGEVYESWPNALRYAAFQVVSIGTSTGFATTDSSVWPALSQLLLLFLTLQCACAGSTSGGIKVDRILVSFKSTIVRLKEIKHPRSVFTLKLGGNAINDKLVTLSLTYIVLYVIIVFVSAAILTGIGVDALSAFSGAAATMGNVGPGLGSVGSTGTFADIPALGKWVLSLTMLLGRLEIYGLLVCLMPSLWE